VSKKGDVWTMLKRYIWEHQRADNKKVEVYLSRGQHFPSFVTTTADYLNYVAVFSMFMPSQRGLEKNYGFYLSCLRLPGSHLRSIAASDKVRHCDCGNVLMAVAG